MTVKPLQSSEKAHYRGKSSRTIHVNPTHSWYLYYRTTINLL